MEIEKFLFREFKIDNNVRKKGGEALISKAWHPRLGQVAIKEWTSIAYNIDNEIELLIKNCNHPNIIQFVGILMNNESNYIGYIMPYMSMGSLHDVIHNKAEKYDEKQISSWVTQICYGLSHLHFKKIIHRDIKPNNVLLGKSHDDIKLSDFGMARSLKSINHTLTQIGTPVYMAPEIFKGGKYDFSADIYSLAITIWEILYRRHPMLIKFNLFRTPYDHIALQFDLLYRISNGERPQLNNNLSKEVSDLLTTFPNIFIVEIFDFRCWHPDASERPKIDYVRELCSNITFSLLRISVKRPIEKGLNKETILLLGGWNGYKVVDSLVILQNNGENDGKWNKLNIKLPYTVWCHGAQFVNNYLYIFGGKNEKEEVLNSTYKLTGGHKGLINNLKWERIADMNERRVEISNSNVILNYQIWVIGGWNGIEGALKSVEIPMNQCRQLAAAAVVREKIFCCGGSTGGGNYLKSTECYDPSSDVWTLLCYMPGPNAGCGIVEMDAHLIVIGGKANKNKNFLSNVLVLDTTDKRAKWVEKEPCISLPRCEFSIAKIDDKIFLCGGNYIDKEDSQVKATYGVEIFDEQLWRNGPKLTTSLCNSAAVVIPMQFARYLN